MAHTNVSSCVLSIVGSFSSGLDVFKKLREERKRRHSNRRRKCDARAEEEEMKLSRSLRQGPEDIGREYANSLYAVGDGFAIGDSLAQTSLAEILLKLNTGLVGIISSFLNSDRKTDMQLDYHALTQLSDRSRIDTCRALRQLFKRMTQPPPLSAIASREQLEAPKERSGSRPKRTRHHSTGRTKVKGPMLARVVIKDSSRPSQIAMVKPSDRRKKSSSSSSGSELSKTSSSPSTPPPEYAPEPPPRPVAVRSKTVPALPDNKPRKKHSAANLPTQPLQHNETKQSARSTPRLRTMPELDLCGATLPMSSPPVLAAYQYPVNAAAQPTPALPYRTRKPTPTYCSIASDSTRLGEIPLHKWNVPYDFDRMEALNRQAERQGWPLNELGAEEGRRRGLGLRRLFGRK